jgi:hypothetical protein
MNLKFREALEMDIPYLVEMLPDDELGAIGYLHLRL